MRRGALIGLAIMAALTTVTTTQAQTFTGTLKKVNDTGTLTIGDAATARANCGSCAGNGSLPGSSSGPAAGRGGPGAAGRGGGAA
jgi:hypothetical protein